MEARDEIVYYLIDHPVKEERIVVFNRDKMIEALRQQKEGAKIRRVLHISKREDDQKDRLLDAEGFLVNECHKARAKSRSLAILLFFIGLAITYLFLTPSSAWAIYLSLVS